MHALTQLGHRLRSFFQCLAGFFPCLGMIGSTAWAMHGANVPGLWRTGGLFNQVALTILAVYTAFFLFQTLMWSRYRPYTIDRSLPVPFLSVIIPAYNEGPMVERSIRSVVSADYPADRLEVLVVDDGSRDDTYFHMARLRRDYPDVVRLIRFIGNKGKRAALVDGFMAARGSVILTLDSDSEIATQTLRAMVAPFQQNESVGAVAGRVRVLNHATMFERMLDVNFTIAFDFFRAAQSSYGTVMCCPGALSSFRRDVILPHLDAWQNQRFLGKPVTHGEDQALTNIVLRAGYDTVYQRDAQVFTLVPQNFRQLHKMLTRWDRSYIVEGFSFAKFMFTRYRKRSRWLPAFAFCIDSVRTVMLQLGIITLPALLLTHPDRFVPVLISILIDAFCVSLYYLRSAFSWRFIYGIVYAFYAFLFLQWVFPYAAITVRDERWGTR